MIEVNYHAALKINASSQKGMLFAKFEYYPGITPRKIYDQLNLDEVGFVTINGRLANGDDPLSDGDMLELHCFVGGGC